MSTEKTIFIKFGGSHVFLFNTFTFRSIDWSNSDEVYWVWIVLGIDFNLGKLFWSISTKNTVNLFYQVLNGIKLSALGFSLIRNASLSVGSSRKIQKFCFCQMSYFIFYYNKFFNTAEEISALQPKYISSKIFF